MMRVCHLNTCPVGIATQDPGAAPPVHRACPSTSSATCCSWPRSVRELMAAVGVRRFDDLVGRTDLLRPDERRPVAVAEGPRSRAAPAPARRARARAPAPSSRTTASTSPPTTAGWSPSAPPSAARRSRSPTPCATPTARVGAMLAGELAAHDAAPTTPLDPARRHRRPELRRVRRARHDADLAGVVNDYCGKGLSGGRLIVAPAADAAYVAEENVVCGNVALYGATAGEAFFRGLRGRALLRAQLGRRRPSSRVSATTAAST